MWMLLSIKGMAKKFNIELPARSKKYLENLEFEAPKRGPDATDVMIRKFCYSSGLTAGY